MKVSKVVVITGGAGVDVVMVTTDLPPALAVCVEPLTMKFEASRGTGGAYAREQFPNAEVEVLDIGGGR